MKTGAIQLQLCGITKRLFLLQDHNRTGITHKQTEVFNLEDLDTVLILNIILVV